MRWVEASGLHGTNELMSTATYHYKKKKQCVSEYPKNLNLAFQIVHSVQIVDSVKIVHSVQIVYSVHKSGIHFMLCHAASIKKQHCLSSRAQILVYATPCCNNSLENLGTNTILNGA